MPQGFSLSSRALRQLRAIQKYISKDSPTAVVGVVDRFFDKFRLLAQNPLLGETIDRLHPEARVFSADPYAIIYRPTKSGIQILQILHGARDIDSLLP